MLRRMFKLLLAMLTSQGINVLTQLLVPALFIRIHGVPAYGEWLVLSAAVTSLGTLNFGITTYVSNELTMLHQRAEMERYHRLQASSLCLLLAILGAALLLLSTVFFLPIASLLKLTLAREEAALVIMLLGAALFAGILQGYFSTMFMVISRMHRGAAWTSCQALLNTGVLLTLISLHRSFVDLAFGMLAVNITVLAACYLDFRRIAPHLKPALRPFHWPTARSALKPSGMFALLFLQNVLMFQVPVLCIQQVLGSSAVVAFSALRTLFSLPRQFISTVGGVVGPEITRTFGVRDWPALLRLYHASEKIVFTLVVTANLGVLAISPLVLEVWLHKPELFSALSYGLMAFTSAALSMKDHKFIFQYWTNHHHELAVVSFLSYLAMILAGYPLTEWLGMNGFLLAWLGAELSQTLLIYRLNRKLFNADPSITPYPVYKLFAVLAGGTLACACIARAGTDWSAVSSLAAGFACALALFALCYRVFDLRDIRSGFLSRLSLQRQAHSPR